MKKRCSVKKLSGFTLIEMLIFIFIFVIVSLAFYQTMATGMLITVDSKNRLGALALANEKMEIARNLKYEDVGTVNGIPSGVLVAEETIISGGHQYQVRTSVQYVDDSFDGLAEEETDTAPNDYKRVKISVSWNGFTEPAKDVSIVSRFVPPGLEVGSGGGVLSVNVINSAGEAIPQAQVHIVNNNLSPIVNVSQRTDNDGNLIFVGAQQSIYKYAITVSKDGYETINTIDPESVAYSHIDVHASVVTGLLNIKSIIIDPLSDLKIKSVDSSGVSIPDLDFHLEGGRILGVDNSSIPEKTVYILDTDGTTENNGEKTIDNQGPGQFSLTDIGTVSDYTLVGVTPIIGFEAAPLTYKFSLLPGVDKTVEVKFAKNDQAGLIVKVMNNTGDIRINEAAVRLTNVEGYDKTIAVSFDGMAFFPSGSDVLVNGEYTLEVAAPGFDNYSGAVTVENLTSQEVKLISS